MSVFGEDHWYVFHWVWPSRMIYFSLFSSMVCMWDSAFSYRLSVDFRFGIYILIP